MNNDKLYTDYGFVDLIQVKKKYPKIYAKFMRGDISNWGIIEEIKKLEPKYIQTELFK